MDEDIIGEYLCQNCGRMYITRNDPVTIRYPMGIGLPIALINCTSCDLELTSRISWEEAIRFEQQGAKIDGFTFATAEALSEDEIKDFVVNFDKEVKGFLDASY